MYKVLHLHLLELTASEYEVSYGYLVPESLSGLSYSEGKILSGGSYDVLELSKDRLTGFRSQIHNGAFILQGSHESFEHQTEISRFCELSSAFGADITIHMVLTEPAVAFLAVHKRVVKILQVAGRSPDIRMGYNGSINTYHISP